MDKLLRNLALLVALSAGSSVAAQDWQDSDYSLSMAGALISDHCGKVWEEGEYISIHACNYRFANLFSQEVSSQQFEECRTMARGDIVMIADCMVERFAAWLAEQAL